MSFSQVDISSVALEGWQVAFPQAEPSSCHCGLSSLRFDTRLRRHTKGIFATRNKKKK